MIALFEIQRLRTGAAELGSESESRGLALSQEKENVKGMKVNKDLGSHFHSVPGPGEATLKENPQQRKGKTPFE